MSWFLLTLLHKVSRFQSIFYTKYRRAPHINDDFAELMILSMECITKQNSIYFHHFEESFPHFTLTVSYY